MLDIVEGQHGHVGEGGDGHGDGVGHGGGLEALE